MFIKRILLLTGMALAAVALSVPAMASADPKWYSDETGEFVPEGFHAELHAVGELTFDAPGGIKVGPCEVTVGGLAVNENAMASGTVTNPIVSQECETNAEGCTAKPTLLNAPWDVTGNTTTTGSPGVEFKGITATIHFIGTCPVPLTTISFKGTATALNCVPECMTFEGHQDDLALEAPFPALPVDITGTLYLTQPMTLGPSS